MPNTRFNPFTRGLLLAFSLSVLGLMICSCQALLFEARHPHSPLPLRPMARVVKRDMGQLTLIPQRLGGVPSVLHGKTAMADYYRKTRWERPLSGDSEQWEPKTHVETRFFSHGSAASRQQMSSLHWRWPVWQSARSRVAVAFERVARMGGHFISVLRSAKPG